MVVEFYEDLFTKSGAESSGDEIMEHRFPILTPEQIKVLDKPFEAREVWCALKGMNPYKASGPDGFQAAFFQRY